MVPSHVARAAAALLVAGVVATAFDTTMAQADDHVGPLGCILRGSEPIAKGTTLFDQTSGGRAIASFTGAVVPIQLSSFAADPSAGRARVVTSTGSASFRLDGYAQASAFPVFSARDLPVVSGHVWIASERRVRLVAATTASLTGELVVQGTSNQTVRAAAACEAFHLHAGTPQPQDVPGNGRVYETKGSQLDLYDQPSGTAILTLRGLDGTSHLFWSTETRGGFVHITARTDLVIDAWAPASQLDAMKRGEMVDQAIPSSTVVAGAQLSLGGANAPSLVVATKEIQIRARRDDKERPIGVVEVGAEMYVMETMAGWSNLLPKHLGFTPGPEGGFWIPSSDVPHR